MHRLQELVRLHRYKTGARETARLLGMGPNTERQYREAIASAGLLEGPVETLPSLEQLRAAVESARPPAPAPQQLSSLERYRPAITALRDKGLGPRAIFANGNGDAVTRRPKAPQQKWVGDNAVDFRAERCGEFELTRIFFCRTDREQRLATRNGK